MKTVTVLVRGTSHHKGPEVDGDLEAGMAEGVCERLKEGEGTKR